MAFDKQNITTELEQKPGPGNNYILSENEWSSRSWIYCWHDYYPGSL